MKFLKQLFCKHIWEIVSQNLNGFIYQYPFGEQYPETRTIFKAWIIREVCAKCKKEQLREETTFFEKYILGVRRNV